MGSEILFRGKHIHTLPQNEHLDGTWIEGYLCNENHINSSKLEAELLIDPDTVCLYTGKIDKNGRKIFEHDICIVCCADIDEEDGYFIVEWDADSAKFSVSSNDLTIDFDICRGFECEVIGNIFDNPELLEVQNEKENR